MPSAEPTRLTDDLWLAAHDSLRGENHLGERALGVGLATGLLAELVDGGFLEVRDGELFRSTRPAPYDPALGPLLTPRQATGLAIVAGRRLPTAAELAASIRTAREAEWSDQQLWQRIHDYRAALFAADVHRLRTEGHRLADAPPPRRPVASYDDRKQVVAGIAPIRVHVGETFPLVRFLVGDFRDRDPDLRFSAEGSYTVYTNRFEVFTTDGDTVELTLQVMVRGPTRARTGPHPVLPRRGRLHRRPRTRARPLQLTMARAAAQRRVPRLPAMLEIWGIPVPQTPPSSTAVRSLGITLLLPDGQQFDATPGWSDTFHQWQRFVLADREAGTASPGLGRQVFVPDDINHMKTVQAMITQAHRAR